MLSKSMKKSKPLLNVALLGLMLAVFPMVSEAAAWDSAGTAVLTFFTGGLTRTIAIICVILCGLASLAGRLRPDWAVNIIIGILLIFGSAAIVDYFAEASSDGGDA